MYMYIGVFICEQITMLCLIIVVYDTSVKHDPAYFTASVSV